MDACLRPLFAPSPRSGRGCSIHRPLFQPQEVPTIPHGCPRSLWLAIPWGWSASKKPAQWRSKAVWLAQPQYQVRTPADKSACLASADGMTSPQLAAGDARARWHPRQTCSERALPVPHSGPLLSLLGFSRANPVARQSGPFHMDPSTRSGMVFDASLCACHALVVCMSCGLVAFSAYTHCASCTLGSLRAWQSPTASPGFRLSSRSLRVTSATTVICGIIVALDSSDP